MGAILSFVIQWVIVPIIMFLLLTFSFVISSSMKQSEMKVSANAGIFSGFLALIIFIIDRMEEIRYPEIGFTLLPNILLIPMAVGLGAGFVFLWLLRILVSTRVVGIVTLFTTSSSTIGLFGYLFLIKTHDVIFYSTLGVALGMLLHAIVFPTSVRSLGGNDQDDEKDKK